MSSEGQVEIEEDQYEVEIIGGKELPSEWKNLVERYKSVSSDSSASVELSEPDITVDDNWRLLERDETTLEVSCCQLQY